MNNVENSSLTNAAGFGLRAADFFFITKQEKHGVRDLEPTINIVRASEVIDTCVVRKIKLKLFII